MNPWLAASAALLVALAPATLVCMRGDPRDRLVGLQMITILESLLLLTLAEGLRRPAFFDLALALALLSLGGGLLFARFFERWL